MDEKAKLQFARDFFNNEIMPDLENKRFTYIKGEISYLPNYDFGFHFSIEIRREGIKGKVDYTLILENGYFSLFVYYERPFIVVIHIDTQNIFEKIKKYLGRYLLRLEGL